MQTIVSPSQSECSQSAQLWLYRISNSSPVTRTGGMVLQCLLQSTGNTQFGGISKYVGSLKHVLKIVQQ